MKEERVKHFIISSITTVAVITLLTIAAELNAPLKDWLKQVFSHHWIGKSVIALAVFLIFSFVMRVPTKKPLRELVGWLICASIIGSLAIFIFFLWHSFS